MVESGDIRGTTRGIVGRLVTLLALLAALVACGTPAATDPGGSDAPRGGSRPLAATVSAVLSNPDAFAQNAVAIPAYVKQVLNQDFLIVADSLTASQADELLIYNGLGGKVDFAQQVAGDRVYLEGGIHSFKQVEAAASDLSRDDILRFHDQPVIKVSAFTNYDRSIDSGAGAR